MVHCRKRCRVGSNQKRARKATPQPATHRVSLHNFVGKEAPEARAGPRNPDAFYRGEEAGAALKPLQIIMKWSTKRQDKFKTISGEPAKVHQDRALPPLSCCRIKLMGKAVIVKFFILICNSDFCDFIFASEILPKSAEMRSNTIKC